VPGPETRESRFYGGQRLVCWSSAKDRDRILQDVRRLAPATLLISVETKRIIV
jgi:hypothetical protein